MDQDMEIMSGYLGFPPNGTVLNKITKKKNWQQKYCILYKASKLGIERLEIYDNKEDVTNGGVPKMIALENCIKITHSSPNIITIFTKSATQHISTASEVETTEWLSALQGVAFGGADDEELACDEDNALYCSSGEGVFSVMLCPSDTSQRCGFQPKRYLLLLTANAIELRDIDDHTLYATWPYHYVRRYSYRQGKFTFEAGRMCETGEGTFHLQHNNQKEIFRCLALKMKSMKQMIGADSLHSPEHSESHFQAAVNMEAGSRSPLPPAARPHDLPLPFHSISLQSKSTSACSDRSSDSSAPLLPVGNKPVLKPKPPKPPRKQNLFSIAKEKHEIDFINDNCDFGKYKRTDLQDVTPDGNIKNGDINGKPYDKVEVRNHAWKTLGLEEVAHDEYASSSSGFTNVHKLISRSQDNLNSPGSEPRIILLHSPVVNPEDENYDRLQYLGSTSKLDSSSGYKKIEARPTNLPLNECVKSKDTWHDYDEVENVMRCARVADDSHLGYGVLRKAGATPGPQVPTTAQAAVMLPDTYLSRPKRV